MSQFSAISDLSEALIINAETLQCPEMTFFSFLSNKYINISHLNLTWIGFYFWSVRRLVINNYIPAADAANDTLHFKDNTQSSVFEKLTKAN